MDLDHSSKSSNQHSHYLFLSAAVFSPFLPWIIVGSLSLLSALLCFLLPETFKKPMLDSIQQMEPIRWLVSAHTAQPAARLMDICSNGWSSHPECYQSSCAINCFDKAYAYHIAVLFCSALTQTVCSKTPKQCL